MSLSRCHEAWKSIWHVKSSDRSTKREKHKQADSTLRSIIISKTENLVKAIHEKRSALFKVFLTVRRYKWREKARKEREIWASPPHTHTHREKKSSETENLSEYFDCVGCCCRTHHGEIKWPGWRGRIQTTLETLCERYEQRKRKKALGTVATKVEPYVSLRPFYWQSWHSPLVDHYPGRDCTHQTFPDTEPRRQKANWEKHRYTVSPWFVKTQAYSESTQARGVLVSSGRKNERTDEWVGKEKLKTGVLPILNFGLFLPLFT